VPELRGLIVDWGGVLTGDLRAAVESWARADGIDLRAYGAIMRDWFGEPVGAEARLNPIHALERGEMSVPDFEVRLAAALTERTGVEHVSEGLLGRMFATFEHAPDMSALVRRARQSGLRTALLSNSWGNDYPRDGWDEMFDVVVISGEVGMRKPEPEIFRHTLDLVGLGAAECVFVDDLAPNVAAAVEVGMVGVLHTSYAESLAELEVLFDRSLR
jgi:HAD superfamily hydrolase (TIGR01509 family)